MPLGAWVDWPPAASSWHTAAQPNPAPPPHLLSRSAPPHLPSRSYFGWKIISNKTKNQPNVNERWSIIQVGSLA